MISPENSFTTEVVDYPVDNIRDWTPEQLDAEADRLIAAWNLEIELEDLKKQTEEERWKVGWKVGWEVGYKAGWGDGYNEASL